ncbi:hypothetical protein [Candidatus Formimonas warabiya]|uniref:Uncharacterized protein n=1 Tax=Formimonas warabiya TaxID=1761012 RepID=A0A3G1KYS6_FORW1|nr:hypothetical protein [Candidatus Formimonas warabiya]ATW27509.1 hypothetical protein DCMF_24605 [Candidatus Formimonas warabiya]
MNFNSIFITGIIGAVIVDGLTYLCLQLGIATSTPWEIASSIFLNPPLIYTPSGIIIGFIGTIALSIATSLLISCILSATGFEYAWLKGIIAANALGFINLGLFMRLLNIWPQIRNEPATNFVALFCLSVLGIIQAILLKKWSKITV